VNNVSPPNIVAENRDNFIFVIISPEPNIIIDEKNVTPPIMIASTAALAAASEVIVATISHMTDNTNLSHECLFPIPIKISSNTRISARSSDGTGSLTSKIKIRYKT